ncbi:hypothetical protein ACS0TW_14815, partial [Klebsiella michiganensis]
QKNGGKPDTPLRVAQSHTRHRKRAPASQELNQGSGCGFGANSCSGKPRFHGRLKLAYPLTKRRDIRFCLCVKGFAAGMLILQFFKKS